MGLSQESLNKMTEATDNQTIFNSSSERLTLAFVATLAGNVSDLRLMMKAFEDLAICVSHVETRPSKTDEAHVLQLYIRATMTGEQSTSLLLSLRKIDPSVSVYKEESDNMVQPQTAIGLGVQEDRPIHIPWFPKHISDLDKVSRHVFMYGTDLDADHPSFKDAEYRKRRIYFAEIANAYKYGQPIPRIEYTESEKRTWKCIYLELTKLFETHACKEHLENLKLLQTHAGYRDSDLPQLEDVSKFLRSRTGFTVRPVAGYLSARDFLSGLAFRVFYCTQYIRHPDNPWYTPEPDCCHELLGHMPMLADPTFAQFSQEIGLASLGTTDEEVKKLATCYFFTVEFGLCRQNGELRAFGAGLLSSAAELKYALSDKANVKPFVPEIAMREECLVTTFQRGYFETPTFEDATESMRKFARTIQRPFHLVYDPYTQSVKLFDDTTIIGPLLQQIKQQITNIQLAIDKSTECGPHQPRWVMDELDDNFRDSRTGT